MVTDMNAAQSEPFLRVPPFPGASVRCLVCTGAGSASLSDVEIDRLMAEIGVLKVGGSYWGSHPDLPNEPYVLIETDHAEPVNQPIVRMSDLPAGPHDPWHLLSGATEVWADANDDLALIAAIAGVRTKVVQYDGEWTELSAASARQLFRNRVVDGIEYVDPFAGNSISISDAIELAAFWRRLIDSNRDISAAVGFAFWKRPTVAPLLWNGAGEVPFGSASPTGQGAIAVWKARTDASVLGDIHATGRPVVEVEDGFIRSVGLGSDCVPPLSLVVDRFGAHFDPTQSSELEDILQNTIFAPKQLQRACKLRELIVASGVSKYAVGSSALERRAPNRRHILVPGQVEDDRAVTSGPLASNKELLRRVRSAEPEAYLIYKPHPDVEAGHRVGAVPDELGLEFVDEIVRDTGISALIDLVDEVHVNSSLAGFEALLRAKPVTVHGVPFYAGWGLTKDLGPVPSRRTRKLTLDELVAAVLLEYPRYLDPVTGLPCPPEVLVRRIAQGASASRDGVVVQMRRLQGRLKKGLASLRAAR